MLNTEKKLDKYMTKRLRSISAYTSVLNLRVETKRDKSRKIRNQACLYVGCSTVAGCFEALTRFMQFAGKMPPDTVTVFLAVIPVPPNITMV